MAEVLLWIEDRGGVDHPSGWSDWKSGDVIEVQADGYPWPASARVNPSWRIVRVGFAVADVEALLVNTPLNESGEPITKPCWQRPTHLNLSALPQARRNELLAPRTGDGVLTIPTNRLSAYRTAITVKPPRQ